jgi:hypothetical protein
MDMNQYTLEVMVRERLAEMHAEAEGGRRGEMTTVPHPLRNAIGRALIRAGTRLLGTGGGPCGNRAGREWAA